MRNTLVTLTAALLFLGGLAASRYYIAQQNESTTAESESLSPVASIEDESDAESSALQLSGGEPQWLPAVNLPDLSGKERTLDEWKGKTLVVNFWATWCPPCRKEIPAFNRIQQAYKDRGVQFIGIALDDSEAIEQFLKIIPIDYPVLVGGDDNGARAAHAFGNAEGVLPYTVFVTREGKIHSQVSGGLSESATEKTLNEML